MVIFIAMDTPKVYKANIEDTDDTGVSLISIVSSPAIESNFVALSKIEIKLATDAMKQVVTGAVLIPDKLIPRVDDNNVMYYLTFDAEGIEKISHKFFKKGFINKTNDEHAITLDSNFVVESWIVKDSEKDKSVALGLEDLPVGTWVVSYKIEDKEYWDKEIMSGNRKGFSLEGFFKQKEIKLKKDIAMNKPTIGRRKKYSRFQRFFEQKNEVELEVTTLKDGTPIEIDEETKEVFILDKETGARVGPAPDGDHILESGETITVKGGKIEMEAASAEPDLKKENEELKKKIAELETLAKDTKTPEYPTQESKDKEALAKKEAEHKELLEKFNALAEEVVKLSKQGAAGQVEKDKSSTAGKKVNNFQNMITNLKQIAN